MAKLRSLVLTVGAMLSACSDHRVDLDARKAYWQNQVETQLPAGSSRAKAEAFFSSRHLEYGYEEQSQSIDAIERDVSGPGIVSFSIKITCTFTSEIILISCVVSTVGTGP
jgi:hypothetical protein